MAKRAKEEALAKSQEDQKQEQQEKQSLRQLISKLQQEKDRIQELQKERQKESDQKLQNLQQENSMLEQSLKTLQVELKNQSAQNQEAERNQITNEEHLEQIALLRSQLNEKDDQNLKLQREIAEMNEGDQRNKAKGDNLDFDWWRDQVKQLESILSSKEQLCEQLRQQKLEVEEQLEQIASTQSQRSVRADHSEPVPSNIANEGLMK